MEGAIQNMLAYYIKGILKETKKNKGLFMAQHDTTVNKDFLSHLFYCYQVKPTNERKSTEIQHESLVIIN